MPQGLSFSNLFVDITNRRTQQTSRQVAQITGAIDQIAGHKKQQRLAAEKEELLKDNREYQENKALQRREESIFSSGADFLTDYTDEEISKLAGVDPTTGVNLPWTGSTLTTLEQDIAGRRKVKETEVKTKAGIDSREQKLGKPVKYNEELGYYVEEDGEKIDADVLIGEDKKTKAGTSKLTSTERNQREWFSDRGKSYPANNIEAKTKIKEVQDTEKRVGEFEGSSAAKMKEGTEVIDGGIYRKLAPEEYKTKTTWFNSPTTKKGVKRNKAKIIEKDGDHFFPVTATTVSTKLGLSSTNAAKVYNEIIQNVKDVEFLDEFNEPDKEAEVNVLDAMSEKMGRTITQEEWDALTPEQQEDIKKRLGV